MPEPQEKQLDSELGMHARAGQGLREYRLGQEMSILQGFKRAHERLHPKHQPCSIEDSKPIDSTL